MANVLLLGGTDSVGTVDLLQRNGFNYFVTTRRPRPSYDKVRYMTGNAHDMCFLKYHVFLSSARVYAPSDKPITEESPRLLEIVKDTDYLSTDEYALSKARQEDILKATGGNYTIIRPYITFAENRFQLGVQEKER